MTPQDAHYLSLFMRQVEKQDGGCWLWRGVIARGGYGRFGVMRRSHLAHRWLYERLVGPIPDGLQIDHLCRVRHCVKPEHLEPVTPRVNTLRGEAISAENSRKTSCKNGHEFTPENTYHRPTGGRSCRECTRIRWREWNERRQRADT